MRPAHDVVDRDLVVEFYVAGAPMPQGSKRAMGPRGGGRGFILRDDCRKLEPWRATVAACARRAYCGPVVSGPVWLTLWFEFKRPASHFKAGDRDRDLRDQAPTWHAQRPDADKLARAVCDSLTGVLWFDDCQVVELTAYKTWAAADSAGGVMVRVGRSREARP